MSSRAGSAPTRAPITAAQAAGIGPLTSHTGLVVGVMGTSFATGQAAGVAAAQHSPGSPDLHAVQAELQRQDARLPL